MGELQSASGSIKGVDYSYTEAGNGDPVVLIPGTLGNEYLFEKVQLSLAHSFRVIVIAHPRVEEFDKLLETYHLILTKELQLDNFHLGGTSVGGWIAQHYTSKYPEMVQSLIIGNSFADNSLLREKSLTLFKFTRFIPWFLFRRIFERNIQQSLESYDDEIADYFITSLHNIGKSFLRTKLWWSLESRSVLEIPTTLSKLIIYTEDDSVVSQDNTEQLISTYPEAKVIAMKSGEHYPYQTKSQSYASHVLNFLDNQ